MSQPPDANKASTVAKPSAASAGDGESARSPLELNDNVFIGKEQLLKEFTEQLQEFEEWYQRGDWLAFRNHHYDWWAFPIDQISSRKEAYRLPADVLNELRNDRQFCAQVRRAVKLMVSSWGWDIDRAQKFREPDKDQKWSCWPVRLYKAGRCMWLFNQKDYYQSLKLLARSVREVEKEKLEFFSHVKKGKANVLDEWEQMERTVTS